MSELDKVQIEEDLLFAFASTIAAALGMGLSMPWRSSGFAPDFRRGGSRRRSQVLNGDHTSHRNLRAKLMRAALRRSHYRCVCVLHLREPSTQCYHGVQTEMGDLRNALLHIRSGRRGRIQKSGDHHP
jgi:hypothetical protein